MAEQTTDYSKFKFLDCNKHRINANHVEMLKESISRCNMLKFKPILVDKDFGILDGQHRFLAAQSLGVPVYYDVDEKATDEVIIQLNSVQKLWTYEDYLNYYASKGYIEYVKIKSFIEKNEIPLSKYLTFCFGFKFRGENPFKTGKIKHQEESVFGIFWNNYKDFISIIKEKHGGKNLIWLRSRSFFRAFVNLCRAENFDYDTLVRRLHMKPFMVFKCADTASYLQMLLNLYNYRNTKPIEAEL